MKATTILAILTGAAATCGALAAEPTPRLNILWIIADDISLDLGCHGNKDVSTPHLDALAAQGALFTAAFTTAPVCSPSRSAFQTGVYQTQIDAQHHRSHRTDGYTLPFPHQLLAERFRAAGYFTANVKRLTADLTVPGKTDLNFRAPRAFEGDDWSQLKNHQPFFAQINFTEPHRGDAWIEARRQPQLVSPSAVTLPPTYPDHPITRDVWANYCDAINLLDRKVGLALDLLARDGLAENTLVVFFGDNGRPMLRGKGSLYDGGIRIPLIVRWPGRVTPGTVRHDLVSAIDFAPAMLAACDLPVPATLPGRDFLAPGTPPRARIFAARDRLDEVPDTIRAVRTDRFKYIRNFGPPRPAVEDSAHVRRSFPEFELVRELHRRQQLTPLQAAGLSPRPVEELYDLARDPHEADNLADHPEYQLQREKLRHELMQWIVSIDDTGATPGPGFAMPPEWYQRNNVPQPSAKP